MMGKSPSFFLDVLSLSVFVYPGEWMLPCHLRTYCS